MGRRHLVPIPREWIEPLAVWTARAADRWWEEAGRPDPYTVAVVSADDGRLAAAVLAAEPACAPALRYVVVNPDAGGRAEPPPELARTLPLEDPAFLYPAAPTRPAPAGAGATADGEADDEDAFEERPPARRIGPLVTFLSDLPSLGEADGAILAAGVLSRLEFDLYERRAGKWNELRLAAQGDEVEEIAVDAAEGEPEPPGGPAGSAEDGVRYRRQTGAAAWLRRALPSATHGRLAVLDEWDARRVEDGPVPHEAGTALDPAQLRQIREPLQAEPAAVPGTSWSVMEWRLG